MAEKPGVAFCSHCDWYLIYDSDKPAEIADSTAQLGAHARECVHNPLVVKVTELQEEIVRLKANNETAWETFRTTEAAMQLLAAEVSRLSALTEQESKKCVCTFEDGLVQEWISKVKAVAKAKGWNE